MVFHDIEQVLCAGVYKGPVSSIVKRLQIPFSHDTKSYYIDLLDIVTASKSNLGKAPVMDLNALRHEVKSGIDLLVDGF